VESSGSRLGYGLGSRPDQISVWIASDPNASSPSLRSSRESDQTMRKDDRVWTIATSLTSNIREFPDRLRSWRCLCLVRFLLSDINLLFFIPARISAPGFFHETFLFRFYFRRHFVNAASRAFIHSTLYAPLFLPSVLLFFRLYIPHPVESPRAMFGSEIPRARSVLISLDPIAFFASHEGTLFPCESLHTRIS